MRGVYAIVDTEALARHGLDVLAFAEAVLDARPAAVQLRDKGGSARGTLALLRALAPLAARAGVPLYANDRPDLALLAGADGVHLGQDDLPVEAARAAAVGARSRLLVGLSTHDAAQVEAALAEPIDYLALGPIFPTASKERPAPVVGLEALAALAARVRSARPGLPLVAIGGIGRATAAAVAAHADAVAVIGALLPEAGGAGRYAEVRERTRWLQDAIAGAAAPEGPLGGLGAR